MSNSALYLKPNALVEPLFAGWYVWPHLIPPATASRNITERHLKIMDSYIGAPMVHATAVKNPRMLGGPFIDYEGTRVDEIKALRLQTIEQQHDLIELSEAIAALEDMLRANAKGFSLESLYPCVPDILRGYVELGYDLNNNASYRLVEPLLYRSRFYDKRAQSIMLSLTTGDDRPFVLSTPRLEGNGAAHLKVAFDDPILDDLFRMKTEPRSWPEIQELLEPADIPEPQLRSFFTDEPPPSYQPYTGRGVRWRYFGHACVLVEAGGTTILLDPVLSYTYESSISRYTYQDLPDTIDYVLITHNHQDHILFETLLQLRHRIGHVVVPRNGGGALHDPSLKLMLEAVGFRNVLDLGDLEELAIRGGSITGLPFFGEHSDLSVRTKLMYLVKLGRHTLMFAADSCNIEPRLYERVQAATGNVDALFLGMECLGAPLTWLYGPLLTQSVPRPMDQSRRMAGSNFEQGIDLVNRFGCKHVYVYAMGLEPWLNYVMSIKWSAQSKPIVESDKLIAECRQRSIVSERLFGEKEIFMDD
jgi:L-ascorbate metabolism protein UlaG (beta-lactamase superfamily)